jgi:hypothetical protein
MNWALAASIAEVIGAIAVVVSLIYVSFQIRSNTKASRSGAYQTAIQSELEVAAKFLDHVDVWDKVVTGAELDEGAETRAAILLYNLLMLDTERRFQQYAEGYLEAQAWEARRGTLPAMVNLPTYPAWRQSLGGKSHTADFLQMIDQYAADSASQVPARDE